MGIFQKLSDMLMSRNEDEFEDEDEFEEEEEYEDEFEEVRATKQVVNGSAMSFSRPASQTVAASRPKLTVHETKQRELTIQIHEPQHFDDVTEIADALLHQQAALVNYDKAEQSEQRRICDFLNGVCYIMDGEPRRISDHMVIYVPSGVEVGKVSTLPLYY